MNGERSNNKKLGNKSNLGSKDDTSRSKYDLFQSKKFLFASLGTSIFLVTISNLISTDLAKTNSNIFFIVLPTILSILSVRLLIKFPSEKIILLGFAIFSVLSAIAETLFIVYESILKVDPFPSVADGFWLAGYLALFTFLVLYLRPFRKLISKQVVIMAILVSAGFLIPSVIQTYSLNADSDSFALGIALGYPAFDSVLLCPVIIGVTILYKKKSDPFLFAVLTAMLSFIAADSIYLVIYNSYENGNPIDIGWIFGYILFSYAATSYRSSSRNHVSLIVDVENKKIASAVSSEAIIRFVVPLVSIALVMIGSIFLADFYFKEKAINAEENLLPIFVFFSIFASLLVVIFVINRSLMKLVNMRTKELEKERDILGQQNEEKTQLIARSKLLESQLQISLEELKKTERSKDEFIAMVTHELKTPLVPIKGYADLLLSGYSGYLTDKQKEKLEIIQSSSVSLLRLIQDLLDVQKIELGQLRLVKQENDLLEIINSAIDKVTPKSERKRFTITKDLVGSVFCLCDKIRMEQVLDNLLLNSMDFVPKENGKIEIKLQRQNGEAEITIKDNGIGIEKEKIKNLFGKFYQADTSVTRERGGTGLGLSICKGIVENHSGKIWAESEGLGKGSEFHILLPTSR